MKKRVIIYVICTLCLIALIRFWPGFYIHMTHMNKEDLAWGTNRYIGETFHFQDKGGRKDSVTITTIHFCNSLNPVNHGAMWSSYHADISIRYVLFRHQGDQIDGSMLLKKEKNLEPVYFVGGLGNLHCGEYYFPVPLSLRILQIGKFEMTDCVLFDTQNSDIHNRPDVLSNNPITSLAWSKKYGLVQYTFQDGTEFNRIDLNK